MKELENIIENCEKYNLSENEVIVARYNYGEITLDELQQTYELLKKVFGKKVIMLPSEIALQQMSKTHAKEMLNSLYKLTKYLAQENSL